MTRRGRMAGFGLVVATAGLLGAACSGGVSSTSAGAGVAAKGGREFQASRIPGSESAAGGQLSVAGLPQLQAKIIKSGNLSLDVKRGTFGERVQEATLVASRHGGYVASSESSSGKLPSGTLVLRVPANQFEAAIGELRDLGKVKGQRISGQDVTSQFVDLQARLRNWQAQETVLLRLMAKSASITDSLRVQNQLQDVQLQIEEIQGQLRVLNDQTALSTITLALTEAPAVPASPGPSFLRAWNRAVHGVAVVLSGMVVAAGYLAPFALMALAGLLGWAGYRRLRTRAVPSA
jgi:hypothetical protein